MMQQYTVVFTVSDNAGYVRTETVTATDGESAALSIHKAKSDEHYYVSVMAVFEGDVTNIFDADEFYDKHEELT